MKPQDFLLLKFPKGSVGWVAQRYVLDREREGVSEHHLVHLVSSYKPFAEAFGHSLLAELSLREVNGYIKRLHVRYASATVRGHAIDIRGLLRWAARKPRRWCDKAIGKGLNIPKAVSHKRGANEADVQTVIAHMVENLHCLVYRDVFGNLAAAPAHEWGRWDWLILRDLVALLFLYESGARVGELVEMGVAAVARASVSADGSAVSIQVNGKSGVRWRCLSMRWLQLARIWVEARPYRSDYVICAGDGSPLQPNGVSQSLVRVCERVGVHRFRSHSLRHAAVRRVKVLGGIEMAKVFIDHSAVSSTLNYAPIEDAELASVTAQTGWQGRWF